MSLAAQLPSSLSGPAASARQTHRTNPEAASQPTSQPVPTLIWGIPPVVWVAGVVLWIAAIGLCLTVVYRYAGIAQMGVDMTQMRERIDRMAQENAELEAQISRLQSISRIEDIATQRLGMVKPTSFRTAALDWSVLTQTPAGGPGPAVATRTTPTAARPAGNTPRPTANGSR